MTDYGAHFNQCKRPNTTTAIMWRIISTCIRSTIKATGSRITPNKSQMLFGRSAVATSLSPTNKPIFFSTFKNKDKDCRSTQPAALFQSNISNTHHHITHISPFAQVRQISIGYTIRERLMHMRHTMRLRMMSLQRYTPLSPVRTFIDRYRPTPDTWTHFKSRKLGGKIAFIMRRLFRFIQDLAAGLKGLFFNWRAVRAMQKRVAEENREMTREEYHFERQFYVDARKILPILVMWKVLPLSIYWLPFVLVTYPTYLPSTFKLGSKPLIADVLSRTRYWQSYYLHHHATPAMQMKTLLRIRDQFPVNGAWVMDIEREISRGFDHVSAEQWSSSQLKAVLAALNVRKPFTSLWPHFYAVKVFEKHFEGLQEDDKYLRREGVNSLTTEQLAEALMARGLRVQLLSERRMRSELEEWLRVSLEQGYNELKQLVLVYYGCAVLRGRVHLQPSRTDRTALSHEELELE